MGRGAVTDAVCEAAQRALGIESITTTELRLMPYVQYVMVNDQRLDPSRVNAEERAILQQWRERGWIEGGAGGLSVTKEFWDGLHEVLWHGYVEHG